MTSATSPAQRQRSKLLSPARLVQLPWPRAALALAAAATLAASLAAIGAPLWLSLCVGGLAGLRVASSTPRRTHTAGHP